MRKGQTEFDHRSITTVHRGDALLSLPTSVTHPIRRAPHAPEPAELALPEDERPGLRDALLVELQSDANAAVQHPDQCAKRRPPQLQLLIERR